MEGEEFHTYCYCPITNIKHLILKKQDRINYLEFKKWATNLFIRMYKNEKIIL